MYPMISKNKKWLWINTYTYHFKGDEHPFTSYFDVHQGYKGFDTLPNGHEKWQGELPHHPHDLLCLQSGWRDDWQRCLDARTRCELAVAWGQCAADCADDPRF